MDPRERLDDPQDAVRTAIAGALADVWTALPCIVVSVDLAAHTITAQPAVKAFVDQEDGSTLAVTFPVLVDVPIVWQRGGGATLTFPVRPGDECLVVFASRTIDTWWQSGGVQVPNVSRKHDLSDGFALVGPFSQATKIANVSAAAVQLRSDDGAVFISLNPTTKNVDVVTPAGVSVQAATAHVTTTGAVTVNAGGPFSVAAPSIDLN